MKKIFLVFAILIHTFAQAGEMEDFIRHYRIKLIPETMHPDLVWMFSQEVRRFPRPLMEEMLAKGASITLIQGRSVTDDPSFRGSQTFDGRSWSDVPGSGGNPSTRMPTRIVVNRFEDTMSANLFLHEHAHALNSLYRTKGITKTETWKRLLARSPEAKEILLERCGSYCLANDDETFSELFAIYHSGGRRMMEARSPEMAHFFRELKSVKEFMKERRSSIFDWLR